MGDATETLKIQTALWRLIAGASPSDALHHADRDIVVPLVQRLAKRTSIGLASWVLAPLFETFPDLVSEQSRARSHQRHRFMQASAVKWLGPIADAGIDVVCLKGMATKYCFYPDPLIRGLGDVDLLVHADDVPGLVKHLRSAGFRFKRSRGTPRWGLSSEASFHPFVAPDGAFSFDLHIHPDDYPVFQSLTTQDVFAKSVDIAAGEIQIKVPSFDHLILIALTNAARDKFGPLSVGAMIDVMVGLARPGANCDWGGLMALAESGGYARALTAGVHLLAALGVPQGRLPDGASHEYSGFQRVVFDGVVRDYLNMFETEPSKNSLQVRDIGLISAPSVVVHRNLRRIRGMIKPWSGLPKV
ncbi:MAG: hypothetical protein HN658_05450 [Rhodospirillales bacterium]|mgnify:FL=1|jgi:hypothetical protein|nr:hypothetical protein [Rhodospirillales bacterium]MBT4005957.1 hypothetical protein [Rhodospirillales bacterium]MBT5076151.1 hypothetical protein [Rhodospirillales bacterium]MBT5114174.1 hypothetical protein [Rhodospirillales bacterium]MBT5673237.1 hypothetical protein [Rhodospirillales bacterium]